MKDSGGIQVPCTCFFAQLDVGKPVLEAIVEGGPAPVLKDA